MSLINPFAEIVTLTRADADQWAFGAASIADPRMTLFCDAPVAATRTSPDLVLTTNTPVSAKRDAGWGNLEYPALAGIGNVTCVMISPSASAVENRPLKKSSADIERLLGVTVAPRASTAAG